MNSYKYGDIVILNDYGKDQLRHGLAFEHFNYVLTIANFHGQLVVKAKDREGPYFSLNAETSKWIEPQELFEYEDVEENIV